MIQRFELATRVSDTQRAPDLPCMLPGTLQRTPTSADAIAPIVELVHPV